MSLVVSWIGVDTHGITSAYIVGESRFSWRNNYFYNYGKKVFASNLYPEIFGYAGDVLFPSIVLSQIIEMIDTEVLFDKDMSCCQKNKAVFEKLCHAFSNYPVEVTAGSIQIIHITRETSFDKYPNFYSYSMKWSGAATGWQFSNMKLPDESGLLYVLGSGGREFHDNYSRYQLGLNKNTSRNVFHCFIDTLVNINDKYCGGPPQLVGIYRKPNSVAKNFGIIHQNKRFFLGAEVPTVSYFDKIEWRNELFELCDGNTKKALAKAAKQPDSLRRL